MPLGNSETHHWQPIQSVMDWLAYVVIKPNDFVIDVGCGVRPFQRANVGVDRFCRKNLEELWEKHKSNGMANTVQCDFDHFPLPFKDKEADFVFCRHTLEDMYNPYLVLNEMQRVGKAGYIETPSPIAELVRGADGYSNSSLWRGYYHHRFFVWVKDGVLTFVSKFPIIEHFPYNEVVLEDALRKGPELWNTYYLWKDKIQAKRLEEVWDFHVDSDYQALLWAAAQESAKSTEAFVEMVNEQVKLAA